MNILRQNVAADYDYGLFWCKQLPICKFLEMLENILKFRRLFMMCEVIL